MQKNFAFSLQGEGRFTLLLLVSSCDSKVFKLVERKELERGAGELFKLSPVYESRKFLLLFISSLQITNINLQIVFELTVSLAKCYFYIFIQIFL